MRNILQGLLPNSLDGATSKCQTINNGIKLFHVTGVLQTDIGAMACIIQTNLIHLGIVYEHLTRGMPAQDEYHVDHCVRRLCHANTCGLKGYGEEVL